MYIIDGCKLEVASVFIDGVWLPGEEVLMVAINDGFDSLKDFFNYFSTNYNGKIIHWTDFKY